MEADKRNEIRKAFDEAVNMTPKELEEWLETDESRAVGQKDGGGESVGHRSGRRIVEIRRKKKDELGEDDLAHMKKVTGYVHRHLAQRPGGDVEHTPWRYSLMNWGHDPLKR
jgi:hypothetical protein